MPTNQTRTDHDAVVVALANIYKQHDFWTCINPGSQRNCEWNGLYMDVIVSSESPPESALVFEIETEETVSVEEARDQWSVYDETFGVWHLVVPRGTERNARRLLAGFGLSNCGTVTMWGWDNGTVAFSDLPGIQ